MAMWVVNFFSHFEWPNVSYFILSFHIFSLNFFFLFFSFFLCVWVRFGFICIWFYLRWTILFNRIKLRAHWWNQMKRIRHSSTHKIIIIDYFLVFFFFVVASPYILLLLLLSERFMWLVLILIGFYRSFLKRISQFSCWCFSFSMWFAIELFDKALNSLNRSFNRIRFFFFFHRLRTFPFDTSLIFRSFFGFTFYFSPFESIYNIFQSFRQRIMCVNYLLVWLRFRFR